MNTPTARTSAQDVIGLVLDAYANAPDEASVREWKSEINSALHARKLGRLNGDNTIGRVRDLVDPTRVQAWEREVRSWSTEPVAHAPKAEPTRVPCEGINMSPTRPESCGRTVRPSATHVMAFCHDHESQRGITRADLVRAREANIAQREEYLRERDAKREAREMLADLYA